MAEVETMLRAAGPQLSAGIRILRRAGRLSDEARTIARSELAEIRDDHPLEHMRAVKQLDGAGESFTSCALRCLGADDPLTRLEAARALVTKPEHEYVALDAFASVLSDRRVPDDVQADVVRVLPRLEKRADRLADALAVWFLDRPEWSYESDVTRGQLLALPIEDRETIARRLSEIW